MQAILAVTIPFFALVLCGKQAVDADNNQLPPRLAAMLGFAALALKREKPELGERVQDGIETLREIRLIRSDLPVFLSSGFSEDDMSGRFAGAGLARL